MGLLTPNKNTEEIDSLKTKIAELESKLDNKEKKEEESGIMGIWNKAVDKLKIATQFN
jgi:hypothetical protein